MVESVLAVGAARGDYAPHSLVATKNVAGHIVSSPRVRAQVESFRMFMESIERVVFGDARRNGVCGCE